MIIEEYKTKNTSIANLAKKYNLTYYAVRKLLIEAGVLLPKHEKINRESVLQIYRDKPDVTIAYLASYYGCSVSTVCSMLLELNAQVGSRSSRRMRQISSLLDAGYDIFQISAELKISTETIKKYLKKKAYLSQ